jgi:hypothetical protein
MIEGRLETGRESPEPLLKASAIKAMRLSKISPEN